MLCGWNCNIQLYSYLIMGSSYVEFNAPDIEESLPGSFPLLNKNTHIWSTFVIRLMGRVFCRLLFHLLAAHILNLSDTASLRKSLATCYMYITYTQTLIYAWKFYSEPT